jgi:hypothetical protein
MDWKSTRQLALAFLLALGALAGASGLTGGQDPVETAKAVETFRLTVVKSGSGTVTSSPNGIDCGETCTAYFPAGSTVMLSGSSDASAKAVDWSSCNGVLGANECKVTLLSGRTIGAEFPRAPHFRFFSPSSFWNTELADDAALDPSSPQVIAQLGVEIDDELAVGNGPWINTTRYSVPIYTVPGNQPLKRVTLTKPSAALQAAFEEVPLPPGSGAAGTDGHMVVWQPSRNRLWEFWRMQRTSEGPKAAWGGAIRNVSTNPGVYGPDAWPNAQTWWGASASSLSIVGGLITFEDLDVEEINHALALAVPDVRAGIYASPAKRSDGKSTNPRSLPEGAHLRLDPKLDLNALDMPPTTRLIAEAAQTYGLFVRDGSSVVTLYAQDPLTVAENPYSGAGGHFEDLYPSQLLASFPWDHLQLLKMELHPDS